MHIRKATEADIPKLLDIYEEAKAYMRKTGNMTQWSGNYPSQEDIREDLDRGWLYVCAEEDSEEPLAVFAFFIGEEPNYRKIYEGAWLNEEPYGVIHRIALSGKARGWGAAKACMDYAESCSRNLRIDTHADNLPMQGLIRKCGFLPTGIIYVEDGTPRLAFQKAAATGERS